MDEQVSLYELIDNSSTQTEKSAFKITCKILQPVLDRENMTSSQLLFRSGEEQTSDYSSVTVASKLFMRIRFRGQKKYVAIPNSFLEGIKKDIDDQLFDQFEFMADFTRILLSTPTDLILYEDIIRKCFLKLLDGLPIQFDCCSRYVNCSDALRCVNPNLDLALGCRYKKNIRAGRVFYGKNAN